MDMEMICNVVASLYKMDQLNLSSLPNELLQEIFDDLPITDCQSITDAHAKTTRKQDFVSVYDDRISLQRYFTRHGLDGKQMMDILVSTHAFLIGSKALEFFLPGSIVEDSDWNFIIEDSFAMKYEFMRSMESMGVVWHDLADKIQMRMIRDLKDICALPDQIEDALIKLKDRVEHDDYEANTAIDDMLNSLNVLRVGLASSSYVAMWYTTGEQIRSIQVDEDDLPDHTGSRNETSGTIMIDGVKVNVTLSFNAPFGGKKSLMKFLHDMPLSISQCIVTGFGAVHLYGKDACKNISYRWTDIFSAWNLEYHLHTRTIIESYLKRGIKIMYHPWDAKDQAISRNSDDDQSIKILSPVRPGWNTQLWKELQYQYLYMKWSQFCMYTNHHPHLDAWNFPKELVDAMNQFDDRMPLNDQRKYMDLHGIK
jgi:hypothetical protein